MKTTMHQPALPASRKNRPMAFTLIELLVVIVILVVLAGIMVPGTGGVQKKGMQTRDLSNARQVCLGLRLYAADHNGVFPTSTISSNAAFQMIVPFYIPSQKIFHLADSAWTPGTHPVEIGISGTLAQGQNCYAYVSGLTDSDNVSYPLVADGFNSGAVGVYNSVHGTKGGVWKGSRAVVVHVDASASIEIVSSNDYRVYSNGANTDNPSTDIFTTGATWMPSVTVVNPQ